MWEPAQAVAEEFALHRARRRWQIKCRVRHDAHLGSPSSEVPHLFLGHHDNTVRRAQQPPVHPVVESGPAVFRREPVKTPHPFPRGAHRSQGKCDGRRLETVCLYDGRLPIRQHTSHLGEESQIERAAVFDDAMRHTTVVEIASEVGRRSPAPVEHDHQKVDAGPGGALRERRELPSRARHLLGRHQRRNAEPARGPEGTRGMGFVQWASRLAAPAASPVSPMSATSIPE